MVARVRPTGSSAHRRCGALASRLHRPCMAPSFASAAPMPPAVLICTPVLPLLVPLPQHLNHPMAHVASTTLAVVPPPHTDGPATSTGVCTQWRGMPVRGSAGSGPREPDNGGLHESTPDPGRTPHGSHQGRGALTTVPVLHLGPLHAFFFCAQAPPLLPPPPLLAPLLPPFSCVPSLGTCMKSSIVHNSYFIYERFIYEL